MLNIHAKNFHIKFLVLILLPLVVFNIEFRHFKFDLIDSIETCDSLKSCNSPATRLTMSKEDDEQRDVLKELTKTTINDYGSTEVEDEAKVGKQEDKRIKLSDSKSDNEKERVDKPDSVDENKETSKDELTNVDKTIVFSETTTKDDDSIKAVDEEKERVDKPDSIDENKEASKDELKNTDEIQEDNDVNKNKVNDDDYVLVKDMNHNSIEIEDRGKDEAPEDKPISSPDSQIELEKTNVVNSVDENKEASKNELTNVDKTVDFSETTKDDDSTKAVDEEKVEKQEDKRIKLSDSQSNDEKERVEKPDSIDENKEASEDEVTNAYKTGDFSETAIKDNHYVDMKEHVNEFKTDKHNDTKLKKNYSTKISDFRRKTYIRNLENETEDTKEYRLGYPNFRDNLKLKDNIRFLTGIITSQPKGEFIDDIHKEWWGDYFLLESHHGYVQWLFPIRTEGMNFQSQPLQLHELKVLKNDDNRELVQNRILKSFEMMLDFYGMKIEDRESGKLSRTDDYKKRYENMLKRTHNSLRITRILKCLGEFDMEKYQIEFLKFLIHETFETYELLGLAESLTKFWVHTIKNDEKRSDVIKGIIDLIDK